LIEAFGGVASIDPCKLSPLRRAPTTTGMGMMGWLLSHTPSLLQTTTTADKSMLDLAVIGSGPCALALVSRLAAGADADASLDFLYGFDSATEPLSDTEQRLAALKKTSGAGRAALQGRVRVFDDSGSWMGKWHGLFGSLGIQHLRSPHVAHPCPTHALALLAHAETLPQEEKQRAFADFSRLRYHGCHRAPSSALFRSLCDHLVGALKLDSLLEKGECSGCGMDGWKDGRMGWVHHHGTPNWARTSVSTHSLFITYTPVHHTTPHHTTPQRLSWPSSPSLPPRPPTGGASATSA
jgi:hypothetical protein